MWKNWYLYQLFNVFRRKWSKIEYNYLKEIDHELTYLSNAVISLFKKNFRNKKGVVSHTATPFHVFYRINKYAV